MREKTVKSPGEGGEYLISEDVIDVGVPGGEEARPCWSVFFRKDGEEDWESVESFASVEKAEAYAEGEAAAHPGPRASGEEARG